MTTPAPPQTRAALAAALRQIADSLSGAAPAVPPPDLILARIARAAGVSVHKLCSPDRRVALVVARQAVTLVLRDHHGLSLPEIGRRLRRDHSTVAYALNHARQRLAAGDVALAALVAAALGELP